MWGWDMLDDVPTESFGNATNVSFDNETNASHDNNQVVTLGRQAAACATGSPFAAMVTVIGFMAVTVCCVCVGSSLISAHDTKKTERNDSKVNGMGLFGKRSSHQHTSENDHDGIGAAPSLSGSGEVTEV